MALYGLAYDLAYLYGPLIFCLIITVSLGVYIIKNNKIHKAWAFITPVGSFVVFRITSSFVADAKTLEGAISSLDAIFKTFLVFVLNAVILGIYLWRRKKAD